MKIAKPHWMILLCMMMFAVFVNANAHAALVEADWKVPGDQLILQDTGSGLEWLDLTETMNQSFNLVSTQLGTSGAFEGFTVGVVSQLLTLFTNAGISQPFNTDLPINLVPVTNFQSKIGQTGSNSFGQFSWGISATIAPQTGGRHAAPFTALNINPAAGGGANSGFSETLSPNVGKSDAGVWLYRSIAPTSVPTPSAMLLFGTGLVGMVGWRWWKGRFT